jgi:hypothetical protein
MLWVHARLNYRTTLQGVHGGRLSPDESLQVIQYYIDKGFRGVISCKFFLITMLNYFIRHIEKSFVIKPNNANKLSIMLLTAIGMQNS